jgi:hypothetical protein
MPAIDASRTFPALLEQHDALRVLMDDCEELADEIDRTRGSQRELARKVDELRVAFEAHNQVEEQSLRSILSGCACDSRGAKTLDAMVADHLHEHRMIAQRLDGSTGELRATLYELRAHLVAEERCLAPAITDSQSGGPRS